MIPRLPIDVVFVVPLHDLEDVVVRLPLAVRLVQCHHDRKPDVHERIDQTMHIISAPAVQVHWLFQVQVVDDRGTLRGRRAVAGKLQLQELRKAFGFLAVAERAVLADDPAPFFVNVVEDPGVDLVVEPVDILESSMNSRPTRDGSYPTVFSPFSFVLPETSTICTKT